MKVRRPIELDQVFDPRPLTPLTVGHFLTGRRDAIVQIMRSRGAWWVAALFVLSAGFAREYDHEYLVAEPWHVLIPFGASIAMSWLLYTLFWLTGAGGSRVHYGEGYLTFLKLFWMTAPMAWLYAIPFERLTDPASATANNLYVLAFVAVWRVLLISRVLSVLTNRPYLYVLVIVLAVSDVIVQIVISQLELPLWAIMGGAGLSPRDLMLVSLTFASMFYGIIAGIFLVPYALLLLFNRKPMAPLPANAEQSRVGLFLLVLAIISIAVWTLVLPHTQAEQRLRYQALQLIKANRLPEMLEMTKQYERSDFPPQWDPPPRVGYERETPTLDDVMRLLIDPKAGSPWIRSLYIEKLEIMWMGRGGFDYVYQGRYPELQYLLNNLPEGPSLRKKHEQFLGYLENYYEGQLQRTRKSPGSQPATRLTTNPTTKP